MVLNQKHIAAYESLIVNQPKLVNRISGMHIEHRSDLQFDAELATRCRKYIDYDLSLLAEAVLAESKELFSDHVAWTDSVLTSRNKSTDVLYENLDYMNTACKDLLHTQDYSLIQLFIRQGIDVGKSHGVQPSYFDSVSPLSEYARQFLANLLEGDRKKALLLIHELIAAGKSLKDIYEYIFQISQYEVGRLWETNKISVAQEHFCTASTQWIMASMYEHMFNVEEKKGIMIGCSIDEDLHELGIRMITDLFELDGWDSYYVGGNMPAAGIVSALKRQRANLLAISSTMPLNIKKIKQLIQDIRNDAEIRHVKVIVGGAAFGNIDDLWMRVGADASANNSKQALVWANSLLPFKKLYE